MLGGHRRPQTVRIVSSFAGVPRTKAMDLDAYVYDAANVDLPARGHHVMSARLASSMRTPELPQLEGAKPVSTLRLLTPLQHSKQSAVFLIHFHTLFQFSCAEFATQSRLCVSL